MLIKHLKVRIQLGCWLYESELRRGTGTWTDNTQLEIINLHIIFKAVLDEISEKWVQIEKTFSNQDLEVAGM